jgi:hypothetical protein
VATASSLVVVDYFWLGSVFELGGRDAGELVAVALFAVMGVAISLASKSPIATTAAWRRPPTSAPRSP